MIPSIRNPDTERVVIDEAGRLVVPAAFRRALGIRGRQPVVIGLVGDSLRLRTLDGALERLQRIARRKRPDGGSAVDAFIAERRADAAEE
jgi:bifunctional DNA-binding transcriptional regulator/antitoxin component of YhaV-PrlF toxin-antitoxin module